LKTTVQGVIIHLDDAQKQYLDSLMSRYCAAVRWSFKRLLESWKTQPIRLAVQGKFDLNSRQANDAVADAQGTISAQQELLKLNHSNAVANIKHTAKHLSKAKSSQKITNLTRKLDKQKRRLAELQKHIDNDTIPTVIFGTKKLFLERCKGNITHEQWRDVRSNRYCSRGEADKGGNLNTRLYSVGDSILLNIAADAVKTAKSIRYNRITVPVYLAHKPSKKTGKINGLNYRQMVLDHLKTGAAYQVEIIRKKDRYYVYVSIEEATPDVYTPYGGAIGTDTNPDGLGITRTDYLGQFRSSAWLHQPEWTYARSSRRDNLIGETAAQVVDMAKQSNSTLVVEDLSFKDDKSVSAKFNRMSHGFVWSKFLQMAERRAARQGVPLAKEKPPFTSVIGILKYQQQYGISNHEAAGYVIARRSLGYKDRVPKPLVQRFIKPKKQDGFAHLSNWKQWSSIKKAAITAIKKLTNKEVKNLVSWQHYRKQLLAG
jgi:IS605 OrfB family transposase